MGLQRISSLLLKDGMYLKDFEADQTKKKKKKG